ncbi:WavE lipopolysaccharide synthesis family protein [Massilia sp. PWRC2]|uniref:WavE lipopolysaccharide synthesis family protein n=1 Tax=Massilia sp. PWRC2 TaxID=2804626 RepID=UPI003CF4940B
MTDTSSMANADFRSGLARARLRFPDIDLARCKLIGWGAGYQFEKFYRQLGLQLAYTVCEWEIDSGRLAEGELKCGIPVHHARRLLEENPDEVLVVVFSGKWFDCMRQIGGYGRFRSIRAMDEQVEGKSLAQVLQRHFVGQPATPPPATDAATIGLMVQGPVLAHITPMVLAASRKKFPFATQILSTWDDTPPALLAACAPHVDQIVTSPVPAQPGDYNAVMQRDSARAGFAALQARGIDYAFKCRTDQSIIGAIDLAHWLALVRQPVHGADSGSRQRIVFCSQMSWRFVLFHLTDQLQFGRVADLLEFWQTRDDSILGGISVPLSAPASHLTLCTPEARIMRCYLRRTGVPYDLTTASYWQVLADRFALAPDDEAIVLNWKAIALFDVPVQADVRAAGMASPVNLMWPWRAADQFALAADRPAFMQIAAAVDRLGLLVSDYASASPFNLPAAPDAPHAPG